MLRPPDKRSRLEVSRGCQHGPTVMLVHEKLVWEHESVACSSLSLVVHGQATLEVLEARRLIFSSEHVLVVIGVTKTDDLGLAAACSTPNGVLNDCRRFEGFRTSRR